MGKKSKPKAPETPDYMGMAREQGAQDRQTALDIADMSRINQVNQMGTQEWSQDPSGRWTLTQNLSPGQQQMFDTAQNLNIGVGNAAQDALGSYTGMVGQPLDFSGAGDRVGSVNAGQLNTEVDSAQFGPGFDERWNAMNMGALPDAATYGGDARQEVIDSVYDMSSRKLDPRFESQEDAMRTRLLNQGVREGTEAWNRSFDEFSRGRNDAYADARDRAILGGGQEQSRLLRDAMGVRGQGFGEAMGGAQQSQSEVMNQLNATLAELGFENSAELGQFGMDMSAADFQNQNRNQSIQEMLMQRQIPMNELAGIIGASGQFNLPQFGNSQQNVPQYSAPDLLGATQAGFQADMGKYNADQAGSNAKKGNMAGLGGSLGGAAIMASDINLKKNIEKVGTANGHNIYVWDWNDKAKLMGVANHPRIGVMAQELQKTKPEAVVEMRDGYLAIDYSKVWEK